MRWIIILVLAAVASVYWNAPHWAGRVHPYVPGAGHPHLTVRGVTSPARVKFCQRYGSSVPTLNAQNRWARCMGLNETGIARALTGCNGVPVTDVRRCVASFVRYHGISDASVLTPGGD